MLFAKYFCINAATKTAVNMAVPADSHSSTSTITSLIVFFLFRFTLVMFPSRICRVLLMPYDLGEAALLDSLISTAYYENKRYRGPTSTY